MTQYSKQVCNTLVSPYPLPLANVAFCMFRAQRSNKWKLYLREQEKTIKLFYQLQS